jgi:hypothetical protein
MFAHALPAFAGRYGTGRISFVLVITSLPDGQKERTAVPVVVAKDGQHISFTSSRAHTEDHFILLLSDSDSDSNSEVCKGFHDGGPGVTHVYIGMWNKSACPGVFKKITTPRRGDGDDMSMKMPTFLHQLSLATPRTHRTNPCKSGVYKSTFRRRRITRSRKKKHLPSDHHTPLYTESKLSARTKKKAQIPLPQPVLPTSQLQSINQTNQPSSPQTKNKTTQKENKTQANAAAAVVSKVK